MIIMKILLAAINAKYIHSNLGVYSLKAYAENIFKNRSDQKQKCQIVIGEYTINHQMDSILQDIYKRKPDMVGFSCYIWNITYVRQLIKNLAKVLPKVKIWLGGPEVSFDAEKVLSEESAVTGIMKGEGEQTFFELASYYEQQEKCGEYEESMGLNQIAGIVFRTSAGQIITTDARPLLSMDEIPFPYETLDDMEHRIIYYESSRGCPYSCSYCLSSIDKTVRFRNFSLVKKELNFFLRQRVPQVKFVDRTFNCKKSHCLTIWKYLLAHDNGVTNFHFEISADILDEEQLEILRQMRPGLIQLEIGVQTANPETIHEIRRTMDLERLEKVVGRVKEFANIHQHLDLIAGLPYEDFDSFCQSFDRVYQMKPDQLQLGFLKVLKGSHMAKAAADYGLSYHEEPPYEVLFTRWLEYDKVVELKKVEEMVEIYYNSNQFGCTLKEMERQWKSPFSMFQDLGNYYENHKLAGLSQNRLSRYEILYDFLKKKGMRKIEIYGELLVYDLYLRENIKNRPKFAGDQSRYKAAIRDFFAGEEKQRHYLKGYEAFDSRQMSKMTHIEVMKDGRMILFDYKDRNPLNYNARTAIIGRWNGEDDINWYEPAEKGEKRACMND